MFFFMLFFFVFFLRKVSYSIYIYSIIASMISPSLIYHERIEMYFQYSMFDQSNCCPVVFHFSHIHFSWLTHTACHTNQRIFTIYTPTDKSFFKFRARVFSFNYVLLSVWLVDIIEIEKRHRDSKSEKKTSLAGFNPFDR